MLDNQIEEKISILDMAPILQLRRNHGMEHATLHVLSEHQPRRKIAGFSDLGGFWIVGDIATEELRSAVEEALARLRNGEYELAVHPNCGTNFATAGILAGGVAALAMLGTGKRLRDKLERFPFAMTLATLALIVAQPLGLRIQEKITTCGSPGSLKIVSVEPVKRGRMKAHRILTQV